LPHVIDNEVKLRSEPVASQFEYDLIDTARGLCDVEALVSVSWAAAREWRILSHLLSRLCEDPLGQSALARWVGYGEFDAQRAREQCVVDRQEIQQEVRDQF
jgi:hypothetical protein